MSCPNSPASCSLRTGGIETTLIFHQGFELPLFAAFDLLGGRGGHRGARHYQPYLELAREGRLGFVLESSPGAPARLGASAGWQRRRAGWPTATRSPGWRSSGRATTPAGADRGRSGHHRGTAAACRRSSATTRPTYHARQIRTFAGTSAAMVCAGDTGPRRRGVGLTRAAAAAGLPAAISFTLETDGAAAEGRRWARRPVTDEATDGGPAYYMINRVHLDPLRCVGHRRGLAARIGGPRANASAKATPSWTRPRSSTGRPTDVGARHGAARQAAQPDRVVWPPRHR